MAERDAIRTLRALKFDHEAGRDPDRAEFALDAAVAAIPEAMLQEVEGQTAGTIVVPAVLEVLRDCARSTAEAALLAAASRRMAVGSPLVGSVGGTR